jgi:hypothetical protein
VLNRSPDNFELLAGVAKGLTMPRPLQGLPDPLGERHAARTCHTLYFAVFWILQNHLQSFSHYISLVDSL